jgi:hypothetical protein
MRPGAFEQMDAGLWNTAMVDRAAYRDGIEHARKEAAGYQRLTEKQGRPEA